MTEASHLRLGREDGVHCGWVVIEVGNRKEAELIVPQPTTGRRGATPHCRERSIASTAA